MSILKSQTKVQQLQKKSADALGIFQNTVNNLADTNAQIILGIIGWFKKKSK